MTAVRTNSSLLLGALLSAALWMLPLSLNAATLTGIINGYECAHEGEACPINAGDPHLLLESDFVLQTPDGEHYLLPNLHRDLKIRYVLRQVQVTGRLSERYHSVDVDELRVKQDSTYETVWSKAMMQEAIREKAEREWRHRALSPRN